LIWVDILSGILLAGGGAFCVIGGVGLLRLPDFFTRCHGAGITDTMGAGLILLGLMTQAGDPLVVCKLLLIFIFIFLTSPVASHALVKAAYAGGLRIDEPVAYAADSLDTPTEVIEDVETEDTSSTEAPTVLLDITEESE
jgi:multicomponent Na+:H+ antiporter subunit G